MSTFAALLAGSGICPWRRPVRRCRQPSLWTTDCFPTTPCLTWARASQLPALWMPFAAPSSTCGRLAGAPRLTSLLRLARSWAPSASSLGSSTWGSTLSFVEAQLAHRKPRACARCPLARQRVRFIALLPASQRGNLVSDTVAGLYAAGGTALYPTALTALTSDLAGALRGRFTSARRRRCRLAEHLVGPALHRTCPGPAAVY